MLKRIKGVLTIMLATGRRDRKLFGDESSSASPSSSSATAADSVIHNRSKIPKNEDSAMNTSMNTALGGNMMTCSSSSRQVIIPPAGTTTTSSQIVTAHPLSPSPSSTNNHHRRHKLWTLISSSSSLSSSSYSSSAASKSSAVFTCMSSRSAEVHIELIPETSDGLKCSPPSSRMTSDNLDRGQNERAANHVMISNSSLEHNNGAGSTTGRNLNYSSTFASKKQKAYNEVQTDGGGFISISSDDRSSDTSTSESTCTSSLAMSEARSSSASSHHHGEGDGGELQLLGEPASSYIISPWDMALNRRRNASHHEGYYNAESASSHYFCTQEEEEEAVELLTSGLKDLMKARDYLYTMYTMMTSRAAHIASRLNSSKAGTIMSWTESSAGDASEANNNNNNGYNELDRRLESKGYVAASIHKYELAKSLLKEDLPKIRVARVYPDKMSDSQARNALKKRSRLLRSLAEAEDMILDYSTLVVQMMQRSAR
ncbi:hypothetical protein CEUSTIGMA_g7165.t1 [Chlamydomonas eustigma]|uniref:Uncharacterized protein n=1 Tax=Chlamydomonas eustigma TaxID=1157962 RepID=A0A250X9G0_9CHLO|nr:hypothetical protein CEUSTIGMA_g7165.t1 [Chlamydomonas eustigma]|eukprot:GAX79724.1 hypothetical protein CEUSTIGMA_g7165.t1 [Chlamydomonas eustigma]